eukprot:m.699070 g.699070  ORF g.699070 m.699070 type:complete len:130 (-) comp22903_c0_seq56:418-807(-)
MCSIAECTTTTEAICSTPHCKCSTSIPIIPIPENKRNRVKSHIFPKINVKPRVQPQVGANDTTMNLSSCDDSIAVLRQELLLLFDSAPALETRNKVCTSEIARSLAMHDLTKSHTTNLEPRCVLFSFIP